MPVRRTVPASAISAARRLLLGHADVALSPFAARTVVTVIDASHLKAKRGGAGSVPPRSTAASSVRSTKRRAGLPLKVITTGGNVPDIAMAVSTRCPACLLESWRESG